jgi:hypothetical protein
LMFKLLNLCAILGLLGTAGWAYSVKYETIYYAEQVKKLEKRQDREREAIAVLRAEWQYVNRPARLQVLNERHLQLQALQATQIARANELPAKAKDDDKIGQKLDQLLTGTVPAAPTRPPQKPVARVGN